MYKALILDNGHIGIWFLIPEVQFVNWQVQPTSWLVACVRFCGQSHSMAPRTTPLLNQAPVQAFSKKQAVSMVQNKNLKLYMDRALPNVQSSW